MDLLRIQRRSLDAERLLAAEREGLHPVAARVVAARAMEDLEDILRPSLARLDHYSGLSEIDRAADRLAQAVLREEVIGIQTDYDADGSTSHAVLYQSLVGHFGHPRERVRGFVGHRLHEGYGLSDPVVDRILAASPRPTLVVTADNGSSDEPRLARLAREGIDVIVTDHHEMPAGGPPASAYACVSPKHPDGRYPDAGIAGCMVAWLLACATRARLIELGRLPADAPHLVDLLDYVAVGTVADCVTLASRNNRAVVQAGLRRINSEQARPCWRAFRKVMRSQQPAWRASDLAFGVGPRINARSRLDDATVGIRCLLASREENAHALAGILDEANEARKEIEREMLESALTLAERQVAEGRAGLVVWLPEGHPGVVGIVASRIVERHGRPVVCISPRAGSEDLCSGSARGVPGFHVQQALAECARRSALEAHGGHAGAGGITVRRDNIPSFTAAFQDAAERQLRDVTLAPVVETDGELAPAKMDLATVDALARLEPFGRGFPPPLFDGRFLVRDVRAVGDGSHLKLRLETVGEGGARLVGAIWFRASQALSPGDVVRAVYELDANEYRGARTVQLVVRHVAS